MKLFITLSLFLPCAGLTKPLNSKIVTKHFNEISIKLKTPTVFDSKNQITALINKFEVKHKYSLNSKNRINTGWVSTYFNAYKNKYKRIYQVSVVTNLCNLGEDKGMIQQKQLIKIDEYVSMISLKLFNQELNINLKKQISLSENKQKFWIKSHIKNIKKMRFMKGREKCDSLGGIFYRYDFFI